MRTRIYHIRKYRICIYGNYAILSWWRRLQMHIINQTVREKTRILQISEASQKAGKSAKEEGQNYLVWLCRKENKSEECQVDLINAVKQPDADLSSYDPIFESCKVTKRLQTQ